MVCFVARENVGLEDDAWGQVLISRGSGLQRDWLCFGSWVCVSLLRDHRTSLHAQPLLRISSTPGSKVWAFNW